MLCTKMKSKDTIDNIALIFLLVALSITGFGFIMKTKSVGVACGYHKVLKKHVRQISKSNKSMNQFGKDCTRVLTPFMSYVQKG